MRQAAECTRCVAASRGVRARGEQSAARACAGAAWERVTQSSTGSGVIIEYFVDKLLTELSILTHPYHIYTIAEPSLLLARRAVVVYGFLFIISKYPKYTCCGFVFVSLL